MDTETILRKRVWALRPALALALTRLREAHRQYEGHHEAGEIWRVIEIGEKAMEDTAGPTTRGKGAEAAPDHLWSMSLPPTMSVYQQCCDRPQSAHAGVSWEMYQRSGSPDDDA